MKICEQKLKEKQDKEASLDEADEERDKKKSRKEDVPSVHVEARSSGDMGGSHESTSREREEEDHEVVKRRRKNSEKLGRRMRMKILSWDGSSLP